ncbi:unnamed protein product [Brassica napus]|uniref:(rape) hypothetical protein n=1 Tax=Brassica napus TaxID=3708 RepID=A0A816IJ42_BRANA|nr:unnamed protein product [Brassica napus]
MVGSMKHFSFKAKSETVYDGITTGWVIHEFILDDKPGFKELVLCRIRFRKRKDNAQYAPRLTPIVIGLEQEDDVAAAAAPVETHQAQGMEQWTGSSSGEVMVQDSNYPILNGGMELHQNQYLGQQQNHILGQQATYASFMENHQQQHQNLFWGHGTYPSNSAQAMEEQQQWNGYFGIVGSPTDKELIQETESEMVNFGNEEWAQQLGKNTPEEEAELNTALANCETFESFLNFFCPTNSVV